MLYGTWLIEGSPRVVLFDLDSAYWKLDQWKAELWEAAHIGVPYHDKESSDAVILGHLIAWFLAEVSQAAILVKAHFTRCTISCCKLCVYNLKKSILLQLFHDSRTNS